MINIQDIILYQKQFCPNELLRQINIIAENTLNTWQQNRALDEIISDTTIGKIAEHTLKNHIAQHSNYIILDYDDFRIDNYKKHAPLDCIIFEKGNNHLQDAINAINLDATNNFNGVLSNHTKEFLKKFNILTMEIKSTRITNRHKNGDKIIREKIINDDFLAYPKFYRKVPINIQITCWKEYLAYCIDNKKIDANTDLITLKNIELEDMYNYYARVYVERLNENLFDIYLIGYISKRNFIDHSTIKRMPQYNKSQQALYIATTLKNGNKFKC